MSIFFSVQNTYQEIQVGLFDDQNLIATCSVDKLHASKQLVNTFNFLLTQNNIRLDHVNFIATNQGPGPFTTLRIVLATVNGISFARKIPLIGIDGLDALIQEYHDPLFPNTIGLLNAFNNDVYFVIATQGTKEVEKGYSNIHTFLTSIQNKYLNQQIRFIGNGTELFSTVILNTFDTCAYIQTPLPETPSLQQIATMGLEQWKRGNRQTHPLMPLYLKKHAVEKEKA